MLAVLIAIRDVLLAIALSWVGVSIEARVASEPAACTGEACQAQEN